MDPANHISTESQINNIVFQLREDPILYENWTAFARKLNVPEIVIRRHRNNLLINKEQHDDVLTNVLHFWIANNEGTATIDTLCNVLDDLSNSNLSQKLKATFKSNIGLLDKLTKPGQDFSTVPVGSTEFLNSTISKILIVKSEDPDILLARFFDKINPGFLEEGDLTQDLGVTGIFKFSEICNENLMSLLERSSKSIVVCHNKVEISPHIINHEGIVLINDELSWDDLSLSFKQRLLDKLKAGDTAGVFIDISEMPKTALVLCRWIRGSGPYLIAKLIDSYICEMLTGIEIDPWNELYAIAAQNFLSEFEGHVNVNQTVSTETKEMVSLLVQRNFLKKDVSNGLKSIHKFHYKYVQTFIAVKLVAAISKVFDLSCTDFINLKQAAGKHEPIMNNLYGFFYVQNLGLPENFCIPPEIFLISFVKFDEDVAIRFLQDCKKSFNLQDLKVCGGENKFSILHFVLLYRYESLSNLVKFILHDYNFKEMLENDEFRNIIGCCAQDTRKVPMALVRDKIKVIEDILKINPTLVNGVGGGYQYPLESCPEIHIEIIKVLLSNGAKTQVFKSVLTTAVRELSTIEVDDLVHFLEAKGFVEHLNCIEGGKQYPTTPLHAVIEHHEISESSLNVFLRAGVSVNAKGVADLSVIEWAVVKGRSRKFLNMLVDLGAQWESVAVSVKQTIMHHAAGWGNVDAIKYFADLGADINSRDIFSRLPIHMTVLNPQSNVHQTVETLIGLGADLNTKDIRGRTPLDIARQGNLESRTLEILKSSLES